MIIFGVFFLLNLASSFVDFSVIHLLSISLISALIVFFHFCCFNLLSFLVTLKFTALIFKLSSFPKSAFKPRNSPLCFSCIPQFWCHSFNIICLKVFSYFQYDFFFEHWKYIVYFQKLVDFLVLSPLFISSLIPLWSQNILSMISILWHFFKNLLLWLSRWSILINFPHAFKKSIHSAVSNVELYTHIRMHTHISVRQILLKIMVKHISLLIFLVCLHYQLLKAVYKTLQL